MCPTGMKMVVSVLAAKVAVHFDPLATRGQRLVVLADQCMFRLCLAKRLSQEVELRC